MGKEPEQRDPAGFDYAEPRAAAMIESLRAFGYDLATAIADLVDNSITAGAAKIDVDFIWDGSDSAIRVMDDGRGMSEDELFQAMRPGSKSSLEARSESDLGRFGLGLKTASFSQCRCLTVASRQAAKPSAVRCWDLDVVVRHDEWRLLRHGPAGSDEYLADLAMMSAGTVVLWQCMDNVVGQDLVTDTDAHDLFLERAERVRHHLAMVFHRFLAGPGKARITVNGQPVDAWDPFLERHPATQELPESTIGDPEAPIAVVPYILPHHSKLDTDTHTKAAGIHGWNAHQGFYVYRNRRLLVAGDWLGTGFQKEEHYKLARIKIDLPNSVDSKWKLDVKKSTATPPDALRPELKRIARLTRTRACEIYRHRGKRLPRPGQQQRDFVWEQKVKHGRTMYSINRSHPLIRGLLNGAAPVAQVRAVLRLLEETIPIPLIAINNSEKPDSHATPFEGKDKDLRTVAAQVFRALVESGRSSAEAVAQLKTMEPFDLFPEVIDQIAEEATS